jgi:hypothetical protein
MLSHIDPDYEITQVKEKFGTLRYYFETKKRNTDREVMYAIASNAEYRSTHICENCSKFGQLHRDGGWLKTLCEECAEEFGYILASKKEED